MVNYYSENVIGTLDPAIVFNPYFDEWYSIVEKILINKEFQKRKLFMHHHNITVWDHVIMVSFKSFIAAKKVHCDARVCAIAGLLHDFYSQAWISTPEIEELEGGKYATYMKIKKKGFWQEHGWIHAKDASINYQKFFPELVDDKITNCIKWHMFPLNIIPPKYIEGWIITTVDKWDSCFQLPSVKTVPEMVKNKAVAIFFNKHS